MVGEASSIDGKTAAGAGLIGLPTHLAELGTGAGADSARGAAKSMLRTARAGRCGMPVAGAVELGGELIALDDQGLSLACISPALVL